MLFFHVLLSLFLLQLASIPLAPKRPSDKELLEELGPAEFDHFKRIRAQEILQTLRSLVNSTDEEKAQAVRKALEKTRNHELVHEPGTGEQFHETWRDEDVMDDDSYSPESFFYTHDTDGNGYLDGFELYALVQHELDKNYNDADSEMDVELREMEKARMFNHTLKFADKDGDGRLSLDEFVRASDQPDDGWMPLEDMANDFNITSDIHDPFVVEQAKKDLEAHPDDDDFEKIMHKVSGMDADPGKIGIGGNMPFAQIHEHGGAAAGHH